MLRRASLVSLAALPFACSIYSASDLPTEVSGQAGASGRSPDPSNAKAGNSPSGDAVNGGVHAGGANGKGGSSAGDAAATSNAGSNNALAGAGGEGGAPPESGGAGGSAAGGRAAAGAGAGGKAAGGGGAGGKASGGAGGAAGHAGAGGTAGHAGAGGTAGHAGTGGTSTGGAPAITGLVASYPCESASGSVLPDTSGRGKHATLANGSGASPSGFSFGAGKVGNALTMSPANQAYVSLPRGIVSPLSEATVAAWVKLKSGAAFQRIFDFGVDTANFMYLVNSGNSGVVRFRISSEALGKNQAVEGAEPLPIGKWTHVAVTIGDKGVAIHVDGAQVAQQAPATLRPADLGDTGNNFIGRSPFDDDPYLDGQVDEFRIYNRVLTTAEVAQLASGNP